MYRKFLDKFLECILEVILSKKVQIHYKYILVQLSRYKQFC